MFFLTINLAGTVVMNDPFNCAIKINECNDIISYENVVMINSKLNESDDLNFDLASQTDSNNQFKKSSQDQNLDNKVLTLINIKAIFDNLNILKLRLRIHYQ